VAHEDETEGEGRHVAFRPLEPRGFPGGALRRGDWGGAFRFAFVDLAANCDSINMRIRRWVGILAFAASALNVASNAAGRRKLIEASLRASSKRTFFISVRSYSVRSAPCSQASASSSLFKSGNFFDITLDLLVVHEAHADWSNSVASPREDAKDPATGAVAEAEDAPLSADDRVAHDVDVAAEQRFDPRQRYAVTETLRRFPLFQSKPPNCIDAEYAFAYAKATLK
jgi:hypothetical protein